MSIRDELRHLQRLTVESNLEEMANLPILEDSALAHATPKMLATIGRHFYSQWMALCSSYFPESQARFIRTAEGLELVLPGEELWSRAVFTAGTYSDFILRRLLSQVPVGSRSEEAIPALGMPSLPLWTPTSSLTIEAEADLLEQKMQERIRSGVPLDTPASAEDALALLNVSGAFRRRSLQMNAGLIAGDYLSAMHSAALVQAYSQLNAPLELLRYGEFFAHQCMVNLHRHASNERETKAHVRPNKYLSDLANHLLGKSLDYWTEVYDESQAPWGSRHRIGVFSSIRLPELDLLANRGKYNSKEVRLKAGRENFRATTSPHRPVTRTVCCIDPHREANG